MQSIITLDVGDSAPPTAFCILRRGINRTRSQGDFIFDDEAATAVMRHATDFGAEYPLDYGHSMFKGLASDPAEHHKAAGWLKLELRKGELWAVDVTWTTAAKARLLQCLQYLLQF